MMNKLLQNQQVKEKNGFWLLNPASKTEQLLLSLFFLLLPTQFGKHFWPDFSIVSGIRIDYLSPTLYVTDILLGLLFFFWCKRVGFSTVLSQVKKQTVWLIVIAYLLLGILLSDRVWLGMYGLLKFVELSGLAFYLARYSKRLVQFQMIAFLFACSALFESILAIFQYLHQGSLNGLFYFFGERMFTGATSGIANASLAGILVLRPYGTFPHPNVLAAFLLVAIVLMWSFLLKSSSRKIQIFASISICVSSVALLLTFSRITIAMWVILILCVFIRMVIRKTNSLRRKLAVFSLVTLSMFVIGTLPLSQEVVTRFTQTSFFEESFTQRSVWTGNALTLLTQNPLIGVGLGNFLPAVAPLQKPLAYGLYLQPVHNIFLLIAAETGLLGLGLFLLFLWETTKKIITQDLRTKQVILVLLSTVLVTGLFDHYWLTIQQGQLLFAVILGLSWTSLNEKV